MKHEHELSNVGFAEESFFFEVVFEGIEEVELLQKKEDHDEIDSFSVQ